MAARQIDVVVSRALVKAAVQKASEMIRTRPPEIDLAGFSTRQFDNMCRGKEVDCPNKFRAIVDQFAWAPLPDKARIALSHNVYFARVRGNLVDGAGDENADGPWFAMGPGDAENGEQEAAPAEGPPLGNLAQHWNVGEDFRFVIATEVFDTQWQREACARLFCVDWGTLRTKPVVLRLGEGLENPRDLPKKLRLVHCTESGTAFYSEKRRCASASAKVVVRTADSRSKASARLQLLFAPSEWYPFPPGTDVQWIEDPRREAPEDVKESYQDGYAQCSLPLWQVWGFDEPDYGEDGQAVPHMSFAQVRHTGTDALSKDQGVGKGMVVPNPDWTDGYRFLANNTQIKCRGAANVQNLAEGVAVVGWSRNRLSKPQLTTTLLDALWHRTQMVDDPDHRARCTKMYEDLAHRRLTETLASWPDRAFGLEKEPAKSASLTPLRPIPSARRREPLRRTDVSKVKTKILKGKHVSVSPLIRVKTAALLAERYDPASGCLRARTREAVLRGRSRAKTEAKKNLSAKPVAVFKGFAERLWCLPARNATDLEPGEVVVTDRDCNFYEGYLGNYRDPAFGGLDVIIVKAVKPPPGWDVIYPNSITYSHSGGVWVILGDYDGDKSVVFDDPDALELLFETTVDVARHKDAYDETAAMVDEQLRETEGELRENGQLKAERVWDESPGAAERGVQLTQYQATQSCAPVRGNTGNAVFIARGFFRHMVETPDQAQDAAGRMGVPLEAYLVELRDRIDKYIALAHAATVAPKSTSIEACLVLLARFKSADDLDFSSSLSSAMQAGEDLRWDNALPVAGFDMSLRDWHDSKDQKEQLKCFDLPKRAGDRNQTYGRLLLPRLTPGQNVHLCTRLGGARTGLEHEIAAAWAELANGRPPARLMTNCRRPIDDLALLLAECARPRLKSAKRLRETLKRNKWKTMARAIGGRRNRILLGQISSLIKSWLP